MTELTEPRVSDYRHRLWLWADAAVADAANAAIRALNNGDAFSGDGYTDGAAPDADVARSTAKGYLCGWSMTKATYAAVLAALDSFIQAGTVKVWDDEHSNIDDDGAELATRRYTRAQVEADRGAKARTRAEA